MNNNSNKYLIISLIITALVSGFLGSIFSSSLAGARDSYNVSQANFLQDVYDRYLKPLVSGNSSSSNTNPNISGSIIEKQPTVPYTPTINYEQAVVKSVEDASPAVVSIIISKDVPIIESCPYDPFADVPPEFRQFFGGGFEFSQPCEKGTKRQEVGGGSGFIISEDGLIVTNKHVVLEEKASYTVFTNDGKKYDAQVLARDQVRDLAIIKISAKNLPTLEFGDSNSVKLGQTAIAIGNALGEFRNTVSVGVISGLSRSVTASGGGLTEKIEGLIQTDAAINQGNSGGPLLNLKGKVIGINVAMVSGAQNISFAIPINQVKQAINSVKTAGRIIVPYLGVRYLPITSEVKEKEKLSVDYGVLVRGNEDGPGVIPSSPAAKAGILTEDIILEVNAEKITDGNSLSFLIQKYNVGNSLRLKILRAGKEIYLNVVLEERPKNL